MLKTIVIAVLYLIRNITRPEKKQTAERYWSNTVIISAYCMSVITFTRPDAVPRFWNRAHRRINVAYRAVMMLSTRLIIQMMLTPTSDSEDHML